MARVNIIREYLPERRREDQDGEHAAESVPSSVSVDPRGWDCRGAVAGHTRLPTPANVGTSEMSTTSGSSRPVAIATRRRQASGDHADEPCAR